MDKFCHLSSACTEVQPTATIWGGPGYGKDSLPTARPLPQSQHSHTNPLLCSLPNAHLDLTLGSLFLSGKGRDIGPFHCTAQNSGLPALAVQLPPLLCPGS